MNNADIRSISKKLFQKLIDNNFLNSDVLWSKIDWRSTPQLFFMVCVYTFLNTSLALYRIKATQPQNQLAMVLSIGLWPRGEGTSPTPRNSTPALNHIEGNYKLPFCQQYQLHQNTQGSLKSCGKMLLPSLKSPWKKQITCFNKQVFLAKAYICASSNPITRTSHSEERFYGKVCYFYNQFVESYKEQRQEKIISVHPPLRLRIISIISFSHHFKNFLGLNHTIKFNKWRMKKCTCSI